MLLSTKADYTQKIVNIDKLNDWMVADSGALVQTQFIKPCYEI